jgi:hypothetical protein
MAPALRPDQDRRHSVMPGAALTCMPSEAKLDLKISSGLA